MAGTLIFTNYTPDGEDFRNLTKAEIDNLSEHIMKTQDDRRIITDLTFRP